MARNPAIEAEVQAMLKEQLARNLADAPETPDKFKTRVRCLPPKFASPTFNTLEQARAMMLPAIQAYILDPDPGYILLIPAVAGTGKSFAGIQAAFWANKTLHKKIMYLGPRKDFYDDLLEIANKQSQPIELMYNWQTRQKGEDDEKKPDNCEYPKQITTWMNRGFDPRTFCMRFCGEEYMKDKCVYYQQNQRTEPIFYGNHNHLTTGHSKASEFSVLIGDENPMGAFVRMWDIPLRFMVPDDLPVTHPLTRLLTKMQMLCAEVEKTPAGLVKKLSGRELYDRLGGAEFVSEALESFEIPENFKPSAYLTKADDVYKAPYVFLPDLLPRMKTEVEYARFEVDFPGRVELGPEGMTLYLKNKVAEEWPNHIIWFDATGTKEFYEDLFEIPVRVLDISSPRQGKIYQVTDRANNKSYLGAGTAEGEKHRQQMVEQVKAIAEKFKNPAIITFMDLKNLLPDMESAHFYANRGSNAFENCDALFLVGSPMPPVHQIVNAAKCIYQKRMRPFMDKWIVEDKEYMYIDKEYDGDDGMSGWAFPVGKFHRDDIDLNLLLWQMREAEIIQAANRLRIISSDKPVYLLTNLPIDQLYPDVLLTIRDLLSCPPDVPPFNWTSYLRFARDWAAKHGVVSANDMAERFSIKRKTATKYIEYIAQQKGWESAALRTSMRGKSSPAVKKRRTIDNDSD